jgi:glycosyltransferase involved in cell wall biosynthesis
MILCLYQLRKDGFPFTLSVAGEFRNKAPRYAWAINSLIEKLGLSSYVDFPGYVNDVARWLRHVDIFVSNSYWEGQQVALLEAMASGCYCLSHCWAGAEEVLPAENIFVTDDELRSKLIAYAKLAEDEKHQAQARMRAITEEKFDERRMVREIVELVERVGRDSHS